jgi:hypothetical protein
MEFMALLELTRNRFDDWSGLVTWVTSTGFRRAENEIR